MSHVIQKEETDLDSIYKMGLKLLADSYKSGKIFTSLPKPNIPLSHFEFLCILALPPKARKDIVEKYLHNGKILDICTVGIFAWAVINTIDDYADDEKASLEKYFIECEEYFDCKINDDGLLSTEPDSNWLKSAVRSGILIETQAYHVKILDVLFLLTGDDMYDFKKKRLIRVVRDKLDGAYVLDREDSLEFRPNNFIAAFFAPELFTGDDWQKTFDAVLKKEELWLSWGGLTTLSQSDPNYDEKKDGESWFFVNNIVAIVLHRIDSKKYFSFIKKILIASTENASWQEHTGRPCEVVLTTDKQIKVQGLYGISLSTSIYLYRMISPQ